MDKRGQVLCAFFGILLLALVAVAIVMSFVASSTTWTWERELLTGDLEYPVAFRFGVCSIFIHESGSGVIVNAVDPNWYGKVLIQHFVIKKEHGDAYKKESFWVADGLHNDDMTVGEPKPGLYRLQSTGYDVFWSQCLKATRLNLPFGIREAFLGYYGLK